MHGFTLSEALVALCILSLAAVALAVGVPAALHTYRAVTQRSEAAVLCSTLSTAVGDELRFAENPDASARFDSQTYGGNVSFTAKNGRVYVGTYPLLSEQTYTSGLHAAVSVRFSDGLFQVSLTVSQGGAERALASADFQISPINS